MVPGMAHCQGGAAPHAFGQSLAAPSALDDPRHDIRRALEAWVEKGTAPQQLVAASLAEESSRHRVVLTPVRLE
jgi:feruloyl esterase